MVQVKIAEKGSVIVDKKEVLRYCGYKGNSISEHEEGLIKSITEEIQAVLNCKVCYDRYDIHFEENSCIDLGFTKVYSEKLCINLKDCEEIFLFTASVGTAVDRIIQKYSLISPSKSIIAQAVGAASIEKWCDMFCEELKKDNFLRPRFSPGYGDLDIKTQKDIFSVLDCERKIGVTLTDGYLMVPTKSVSAIVGISKKECSCVLAGCEECNKKCEFRRN